MDGGSVPVSAEGYYELHPLSNLEAFRTQVSDGEVSMRERGYQGEYVLCDLDSLGREMAAILQAE